MTRQCQWQTDRLLIRQFQEDDLKGLFELHGDPLTMHFLGGPWDIDKTRQVLNRIIANYSNTELEWMAVTRRSDGAVIGVCWLGRWGPFWRDVLPAEDMELGYRYARQYWGQGYATEAARAMVARGFNELNLHHVAAIVDVNNAASERVLQKIGGAVQRDVFHCGIHARYYTISNRPC